MAETREDLLSSLSETLADYRVGEVSRPTPEHVRRWLEQFPAEKQPVVLAETARVLGRLYVSRARAKELLRAFIARYLVADEAPHAALGRVRFLRVQTQGGSQREMLRLADEVLREEHGLSTRECGNAGAARYVYLDDALYTGNRLRRDLASEEELAPGWLTRAAPRACSLMVYVTCCHSAGWRYALEHLRREATPRQISFRLYPGMVLENDRAPRNLAQCLWPEAGPFEPETARYVSRVREERRAKGIPEDLFFRPEETPPEETLFGSPEARRMVERALLRAGVRITDRGDTPRNMRPLGFEALDTLGFGTLFASYHNIANNCPLALWWDRPGVWSPLLPRRVSPPERSAP